MVALPAPLGPSIVSTETLKETSSTTRFPSNKSCLEISLAAGFLSYCTCKRIDRLKSGGSFSKLKLATFGMLAYRYIVVIIWLGVFKFAYVRVRRGLRSLALRLFAVGCDTPYELMACTPQSFSPVCAVASLSQEADPHPPILVLESEDVCPQTWSPLCHQYLDCRWPWMLIHYLVRKWRLMACAPQLFSPACVVVGLSQKAEPCPPVLALESEDICPWTWTPLCHSSLDCQWPWMQICRLVRKWGPMASAPQSFLPACAVAGLLQKADHHPPVLALESKDICPQTWIPLCHSSLDHWWPWMQIHHLVRKWGLMASVPQSFLPACVVAGLLQEANHHPPVLVLESEGVCPQAWPLLCH